MLTLTNYPYYFEEMGASILFCTGSTMETLELRRLSDIEIWCEDEEVSEKLYNLGILRAEYDSGESVMARIFGQDRVVHAASSLLLPINNEYILD